MKKLLCILIFLIGCFTLVIAEDDLELESLLKWAIDNIDTVEKDCKTLTVGKTFSELIINDVKYTNPGSVCQIVEIKPEKKGVYKIVFSQLVRLHSEWEERTEKFEDKWYVIDEEKKADTLTLQYKTIYISEYDKISIQVCAFSATEGYYLGVTTGNISIGDYNEIHLSGDLSVMPFPPILDRKLIIDIL